MSKSSRSLSLDASEFLANSKGVYYDHGSKYVTKLYHTISSDTYMQMNLVVEKPVAPCKKMFY